MSGLSFLVMLKILNFSYLLQIFGLLCGLESFLCIFNCGRKKPPDKSSLVQESSTHFTLHDNTAIFRAGSNNKSRGTTQEEIQLQTQPPHKTQTHLVNENFVMNSNANQRRSNYQASSHATTAKHNHSSSKPVTTDPKPSAPSPPSSRTSSPPAASKSRSAKQVNRRTQQQQPNSNTAKSTKSADGTQATTEKMNPSSSAKTGKVRTKALVSNASSNEAEDSRDSDQPPKSTGAIPKKKRKNNKPANSDPSPSADVPTSNPPQPAATKFVKPSTNHLDEIISIPLEENSPKASSSHHRRYVY